MTMFLTKSLAITSRMLAIQIQDFSVRNIEQSLARILYSICCCRENFVSPNDRIIIPITHEELANILGSHRVTVTKILNRFKQQGILQYKYEKIIILEKQKLKELALV